MLIQQDYVVWVDNVQMDIYVRVNISINHLLNMIIYLLMKYQIAYLLYLYVILLKVG